MEKALKDDYKSKLPESPSCIRFPGVTMNNTIRLYIRTLVENVVAEYKQELLKSDFVQQ